MKKFYVERPNDDVVVYIMINRQDNKYHFVNLSHGHICSCAFDTMEDAIEDLNRCISEGSVLRYFEMT